MAPKTNVKKTNNFFRKDKVNIKNLLLELNGRVEYLISKKGNIKNIDLIDIKALNNNLDKSLDCMGVYQIIKFTLSTEYLNKSFFDKNMLLRLFKEDVKNLKEQNKVKNDYTIEKEFDSKLDKEAYEILNYNLLRELNGTTTLEKYDIEYFLNLNSLSGYWNYDTNEFISVKKHIENKYLYKRNYCLRILKYGLDETSRFELYYFMSKNKEILNELNFDVKIDI